MDLPSAFGLVAAEVFASYIIHHGWMSMGVVGARKKYGVKYPAMYASETECKDPATRNLFNCIQRAHQNSLENQPAFLALLITGGLKYPITAAISGAVYLVGRIFYFTGYSTGDPKKRYNGGVMYLGTLGLLGCVGKLAFDGLIAMSQGK